MKLVKEIICLLLVPVLIAGCIKEDLEDCDNFAVSFRYDADGAVNVIRQYIDKIDLYVFDESHRLVDVIAFGQDEIAEDELMSPRFRLPAGKYTLVALGNAYDRTTVEGTGSSDLSRTYIQHPSWGTSTQIPGHDHNYMGQKVIEIPSGSKSLHETVRLYSSHIDVDVEIHGLQAPASGQAAVSPCRLSFLNANAQTDFNNEINPGQTETIVPALVYDASTNTWHTEDLSFFRMDRGGTLDDALCRHILRLEDNEGKVLAEFDLADYIAQHRDVIDVTRQEAYLPISITFTPIGITIEIPGWYIEDIQPGWTK